jgi:hypothetical protein
MMLIAGLAAAANAWWAFHRDKLSSTQVQKQLAEPV